jgi:hypothetical protein
MVRPARDDEQLANPGKSWVIIGGNTRATVLPVLYALSLLFYCFTWCLFFCYLFFFTFAYASSSCSGCYEFPFLILKNEIEEDGQMRPLSAWEEEILSYGNNWEHDEGTSHASDLEFLLKVIEYSHRSDYQVFFIPPTVITLCHINH